MKSIRCWQVRVLGVCLLVLFGLGTTGTASAQTPDQKECAREVLDIGAPDWTVAWPAIVTCFEGQIDTARAWTAQVCVTGTLVPDPVRPVLCGIPINSVDTYQEGPLIYLSVRFSDPSGLAHGFGFRGANGSGWAEENHPFSDPSYGRVSPGRVDYPFNHDCGGRSIESDVEFWVINDFGVRGEPAVAHLTCGGAR
jgi:hypothetical protein